MSCVNTPTEIDEEDLVGIWSGMLFQTESVFDSLTIEPFEEPQYVTFFKNGKKSKLKLERINNTLFIENQAGLRLDITYNSEAARYIGTFTNDHWVQGLIFSSDQDKWVTEIRKPEIIDTDYTVFLEFYEDDSGTIQAKIQSNKENRELHFEIESVKINGDRIDFDITNKRFGISALFNSNTKDIQLTYSNAGGKREIQLTKLEPSEIKGFKPLANQEYIYSIPIQFDDVFKVNSLEKVGINASMLEFMSQMNSGRFDHIHSIIITKDNQLVFEEYFHNYNRDYLHDIRSSFKSISSLLLGKIVEQNSIDLNQSILDYYPDYDIEEASKKDITIHHVLTMSTGLALENEDEMQRNHRDWVLHKLNLPLVFKPGEKFEYSSGGMNLLTDVIQENSEKYYPLSIFESVFMPMGIEAFQMKTSPVGRPYLAGDFYLRPIDFTKFGLLVLNDGMWNGQQIISSSWIDNMTEDHIQGSWPKDSRYGYLWRLLERNVGGKQMNTIEAWGNGGQFLIIIPEVKMTITFTGGNYNLSPEMEDKPFEILEKYVLPAVKL